VEEQGTYIQGENRNQVILFPESIDDYISEDSPIRVIEEYVEQLDIIGLGFQKAICPLRGRPPYDPRRKNRKIHAGVG